MNQKHIQTSLLTMNKLILVALFCVLLVLYSVEARGYGGGGGGRRGGGGGKGMRMKSYGGGGGGGRSHGGGSYGKLKSKFIKC